MHLDNVYFSIILAAYNVEKTIEFTLNSLEHQTYRNFEVIIINDDSKDSTHKIISDFISYSGIESITYIINSKNSGLSEVRNKGIDIAKGEYVLFLDGDDAYHSQSLSCLNDRLKKYKILPDSLFFSGATFLEEIKQRNNPYSLELYEDGKGYNREDLGTKLVVGLEWFKDAVANKTYHDAACLIAINTDFLKKNKITFVPNLIFEDTLFTRAILLLSHKIGVSNDMILLIRKAPGSIMRSPLNLSKVNSRFYISKTILNYYKQRQDSFFYQDSLNFYMTNLRLIKKSPFLFFLNSPCKLNIYFFIREKVARNLIISLLKYDIKKLIGYSNSL